MSDLELLKQKAAAAKAELEQAELKEREAARAQQQAEEEAKRTAAALAEKQKFVKLYEPLIAAVNKAAPPGESVELDVPTDARSTSLGMPRIRLVGTGSDHYVPVQIHVMEVYTSIGYSRRSTGAYRVRVEGARAGSTVSYPQRKDGGFNSEKIAAYYWTQLALWRQLNDSRKAGDRNRESSNKIVEELRKEGIGGWSSALSLTATTSSANKVKVAFKFERDLTADQARAFQAALASVMKDPRWTA